MPPADTPQAADAAHTGNGHADAVTADNGRIDAPRADGGRGDDGHADSPRAAHVRLANDIAAQFAHLPPDVAAARIATHLRMFWDPRMRAQLIATATATTDAHATTGATTDATNGATVAGGPTGLDPLAAAATRLLS